MKLFNNPEIRRALIAASVFILSLSLVSGIFSETAGIAVLICGAFLTAGFLFFTARRYKRISRLSQSIESILQGSDSISIKSLQEGELSLLESDVQKILTRLRDQRDILKKDRSYLADSIADISHQLRTPLTSINLILTLLRAPDITEQEQSRLLRELTSLIGKTEYLVTVLLKISRIDTGTVQFEKKPVRLDTLLRAAAEPLMLPMDIKNQSLSLETGDLLICCDPLWCTEALGNILKNCTEHTPEGGSIRVVARDTPIFTELVISDTGCGFSEEDLPHVFERFYKGKDSSKESFGIGLNLTKMIITAQSGTITAKNTPEGHGEFTLRFYKQVV